MAAGTITADTFDDLTSTGVVLVDNWAPWCGPCRAMGPVVDEIADEMSGMASVYKCDVDENPAVAERMRIMSIPTLLVFKDGQLVKRLVGSTSKAELVGELRRLL